MNRRQHGHRIVWFVRFLAAIGLVLFIITAGSLGWMLAKVRTERAHALAEQERLSQVSQELRQNAIDSRMEIAISLDETALRTNSYNPLANFQKLIHFQLNLHPDPAVLNLLTRLDAKATRLAVLSGAADAWRAKYLQVWDDLRAQRTLSKLRDIVSQMRGGVEAFEGSRHLETAMKFRRWRNSAGEDAAQQARSILLDQAQQQRHDMADLKNQLAELGRLVELLAGEELYDNLADLKDNKLKPVLDRLEHSLSQFDFSQTEASMLTSSTIDKLKAALFGEGYANDEAHQTILPGRGGLFILRRDVLQLRREREALKNTLATLFQEIEAANADFARSAQARNSALSQRVEENLTTNWRRLLVLGGGCSALFLWLAWVITRGVNIQVQALEDARAEAENGRHTTEKLLTEQQKASEELATAHQRLQVSEQRFRMLNVSAPIGIFLTDPAGSCLYTNPHWGQLTGFSLEGSLGDGWHKALHPEDAAGVLDSWKTSANEGSEFNREFRFQKTNGDVRWVHARSASIRSEAGEVTGHVGTVEDITERKTAEAELEKMHKELLSTSRQAGMAEVATSVLHNVGNVLNSVNVSTSVLAEKLKKSKSEGVSRVAALLREHAGDLSDFISKDAKGRHLPFFLQQLGEQLEQEKSSLLNEVASLAKNVDHIKDVVAMQQSYAKISGVTEKVRVTDLVEDALRMNASALIRHDVHFYREYAETLPDITIEKHKVLQILVNLIRNAKQACDESGSDDKRLTMRVTNGSDKVRISLIDNGIGIPPENLARIFNHGFTTKKEGHGFGLHSGALAARELGGSLSAQSDGLRKGSVFTLELPCEAKKAAV